ncbi:site-specific tyrosine recombinase XerC [Paraburkholderia dioscoreae]|uniref:Tyrosine recombinase XerC 2 n=1 Tax=Paraburkholderia dioscoreae TaxID=2604047 RepID=A0A5Q4YV47_9BURK|nr:site-specific tyrosine recombinase XerC [Paraburkholderia dioscoreae]VVD28102.1 Tyrosine recombinase XerC 2 [Paraburkholderia dioscoreae]VVD28109.1 Tyrosine recombinase XerC 2 [Paraburkholderia dioscoreae]
MRKRLTPRAPLPVIGPADDAQSLYHQMRPFLEWMRVRNYSEETVVHRETHLRGFIAWCDERGVSRPQEVTRPILERYQRHLFLYRKANGEALSGRSQHMRLVPVKLWFRWLVKQNRILSNPAADIDMPRVEKRLPKHILSAEEAERVLNVPDVSSALGIRDRAILETFYSTGIRRAELVNLYVHDVDADRGTVMIRQGKGSRDRLIPIGARALAWIRKYLDEVRPQLSLAEDEGVLFLAVTGDSIGTRSMGLMVSDYIKRSGVNKSGSCHLFRHTMATLMLENGADVRFVQVMLGHAQLTSTQVYTQVAIRALKEIHTATHPARLERREDREQIDEVKPMRLLHRVYGKSE